MSFWFKERKAELRVLRLRLGCQGQCTSKGQGRGTEREHAEASSPPPVPGAGPSADAHTQTQRGRDCRRTQHYPPGELTVQLFVAAWVARMRPRLVSDKPVPHPEGLISKSPEVQGESCGSMAGRSANCCLGPPPAGCKHGLVQTGSCQWGQTRALSITPVAAPFLS